MRIRIKILNSTISHANLYLYADGDLITDVNGITLRNSQVPQFLILLEPEIVIVDRSHITDDLWKRIRDFKAVQLI
jgi:hypothetical protein